MRTLVFAASCALLRAADVAGTWTGTFKAGGPNGGAHALLVQSGNTVTGTAGPSANEQHPISRGTVEGSKLRFDLERESGVMRFFLDVDGDKITGFAERQRDGQTERAELTATRKDLAATVRELDKALFDAYNACDLPALDRLFAKDIEFYHDQGGVSYGSAALLEAQKKNICGKVRRELVSLTVYPIPGYGAIEEGAHTFFNRSSGKEEGGDKVMRFVQIWRNQGGEWKLTRVVSYAH